MHSILDRSTGNVIGIQVSGTLSSEEYSVMTSLLEERIEEYGDVHILFEMKDFEGWTPQGLWQDVKFDVSHNQQMTRAAFVGEKAWEKWMSRLAKPFAHAEVRYFDRSERDEAWKWIRRDAILTEG